MRPSSLRALLLAFALVIQTIAGGVGVARAMPGELALKAHCAEMAGQAGEGADSRHQRRHQHCESCCLCAGPPGVSLTEFAPAPMAPRAYRVAAPIPGDAGGVTPRLAQARFARGPPADSVSA
ncbi:hypothetical protein [Methylocystis echinoides]|uniref:hypothetical protein n=1 Tax=Methylocystis echinoides TaxID=29468 RepID=UPI003431FF29